MRIQKIYAKLAQENLNGLIVSSPANISYLTNFAARDSYFIISKKANIYVTDSRYIGEAKKDLKGLALIKKVNGSVFKIIADACIHLGLKRIGFEERYLHFAEHKKLKEELRKKSLISPVVKGTIMGFGPKSYSLGLEALIDLL